MQKIREFIVLAVSKDEQVSPASRFDPRHPDTSGKKLIRSGQWFIRAGNDKGGAGPLDVLGHLSDDVRVIGVIEVSDRDADAIMKGLNRAWQEPSDAESSNGPEILFIAENLADTAPLVTHVVALEEELAHMGSRYGFTDRARELLSKSPVRAGQ